MCYLFVRSNFYCRYDYVAILDKLSNEVGRRHCGSYIYPVTVDVKGNVAIIVFRSDSSNGKRGFLITYSAHVSTISAGRYWQRIWSYVLVTCHGATIRALKRQFIGRELSVTFYNALRTTKQKKKLVFLRLCFVRK